MRDDVVIYESDESCHSDEADRTRYFDDREDDAGSSDIGPEASHPKPAPVSQKKSRSASVSEGGGSLHLVCLWGRRRAS